MVSGTSLQIIPNTIFNLLTVLAVDFLFLTGSPENGDTYTGLSSNGPADGGISQVNPFRRQICSRIHWVCCKSPHYLQEDRP